MQYLRFHHVGIPVDDVRPNMTYSPHLKMHASGYFDSPYAIEWMCFDADNPLPDIIKSQVHVAYEVGDLDAALEGKKVVQGPDEPKQGVRTAFIVDGEALIELLQFSLPEQDVWPHPGKFWLR